MAVLALVDGRVREARRFAEQAVELEVRASGLEDADTGHKLIVLTNVYHWIGSYEDAEKTARDALTAFGSVPDAHPQKIEALVALGGVLADRGKFAEAETFIKRAIVLNRTLYGPMSEYVAFSKSQLALLRDLEGRPVEAERLLREIVASEDATRSDKVGEAKYHMQLASVLCTQGRHAEGVTEARHALRVISGNMRDDHPYAAATQEVLASGLFGLGQLDEAEAVLRSAMKIWRNNGVWPWRAGRSASALSDVLLAQGRISEAEKYLAYASSALENAPDGQMEQKAIRDHHARQEKLRTTYLASKNHGLTRGQWRFRRYSWSNTGASRTCQGWKSALRTLTQSTA